MLELHREPLVSLTADTKTYSIVGQSKLTMSITLLIKEIHRIQRYLSDRPSLYQLQCFK